MTASFLMILGEWIQDEKRSVDQHEFEIEIRLYV